MEAAKDSLEGPGPVLTSVMECRSIAYDMQLEEEQRAIARKVAAQPWPQSALALRQMDTFASPRCTPEWLHRSWQGDPSLLAVAAEVEAAAEAARLAGPSPAQDGPRPLPAAGALPLLGVPVAGLGTVGMDPETAAAALSRAARAGSGGSQGGPAWGRERVLDRGRLESTEAVLLFSALLQSRVERWRAGSRGRKGQSRGTGGAAGESAGREEGGGGREYEFGRGGGGGRGRERGEEQGGVSREFSPGATAAAGGSAAESVPEGPQVLGHREPALRWLPPLAAKGGGRCKKRRQQEDAGRPEAASQRAAQRRKSERVAAQDEVSGSAGGGCRDAAGRCVPQGPSSELPNGLVGEGAQGEEEGEEAWQGVRAVCDEGAVLAWRLIGQQLLRRAQEAGQLTPSLEACLQGPRTALSSGEAAQQGPELSRDALPLGRGKMRQQLSTLLALAPLLTPRTQDAIASRLRVDLGRKASHDFQLLHP